jgi:hypothetical protein
MFRTLLIALSASFVTALIVSAGTVLAVGGDTASIDSLGYTRACTMAASPWTAVATSNVAGAYTAALTVGQRYVIQCDDDTYLNPAAVITGADVAAAGDGWIPAGAWYDHIVFTATPYVSLLNKTKDSDCRIALCK